MNRRITIGLLAISMIAACGSGDDDVLGLGDRGLDRCSLITIEDAEDWLGAPVTAAPTTSFDGEPDPVTCLYTGGSGSVLVQIRDGEVFHSEPGSPTRIGEDVAGIGEDAFMDEDGVQFLQNDWSVSVSQITGVPDSRDLLEMARVISERLP